MSSVNTLPSLSPQAIEEFRTNALRIRAPVSAERLWSRYLTPEDQERLGGNLQDAFNVSGTSGMWMRLRGVTYPRAIADVANKLGFLRQEDYEWLLREAGETVETAEVIDGEDALAIAIDSGAFVLVERPRDAYWNGERIEIDWERQKALWEFVWEFARAGKAGEPIDRLTFGESSSRDIVTKRKCRLAKIEEFPIELIDAMEIVAQGTQQLMLPLEQIKLFESCGVEGLQEWNP